ncbi:hypothetical protein D6T64_17980 [Cryobacterium melibiosiphilum]|uniref:Uncharacterized protein n=1 Tax=Cryobacterium melibiosiphilum TaxID=995039 RepID=A0A3A5MDC8_9MICO|nr:hypothetical protein D6T64_17980 [Cryobacterium melibiosiphilum]
MSTPRWCRSSRPRQQPRPPPRRPRPRRRRPRPPRPNPRRASVYLTRVSKKCTSRAREVHFLLTRGTAHSRNREGAQGEVRPRSGSRARAR